jgi:hypothetical protein
VDVKAGLPALIDHASEQGGWSLRRSSAALGIDPVRGAALAGPSGRGPAR